MNPLKRGYIIRNLSNLKSKSKVIPKIIQKINEMLTIYEKTNSL